MALLAALALASPDRVERQRAISAAKAMVGRCGRLVGQEAVQLHGGMGMTEELAVSHFFKRLTAIQLTFGDTDHHVARFGALPG